MHKESVIASTIFVIFVIIELSAIIFVLFQPVIYEETLECLSTLSMGDSELNKVCHDFNEHIYLTNNQSNANDSQLIYLVLPRDFKNYITGFFLIGNSLFLVFMIWNIHHKTIGSILFGRILFGSVLFLNLIMGSILIALDSYTITDEDCLTRETYLTWYNKTDLTITSNYCNRFVDCLTGNSPLLCMFNQTFVEKRLQIENPDVILLQLTPLILITLRVFFIFFLMIVAIICIWVVNSNNSNNTRTNDNKFDEEMPLIRKL
jgi:hypothetical protein